MSLFSSLLLLNQNTPDTAAGLKGCVSLPSTGQVKENVARRVCHVRGYAGQWACFGTRRGKLLGTLQP